jgi:oligopeptide/dipeptide ABC transporter ATP-binding protein
LMTGFPPLGGDRRRIEGIAGQPPDLRQHLVGCSFAPRCPDFMAGTCDVIDPPEVRTNATRRVECHLFEKVGSRVE